LCVIYMNVGSEICMYYLYVEKPSGQFLSLIMMNH
jgi:hypothetical protein